MRIEEIFEQEGTLTESRVISAIRSISKKTAGGKSVNPIVLQSPLERSHYEVFVGDGRDYFRFQFERGRPTKPKKISASDVKKEFMGLRGLGWTEVDSRSFFSKHWLKMTAAFIASGVFLLTTGPLAALGPILTNILIALVSEVRNSIATPMDTGPNATEILQTPGSNDLIRF